MSITAFPTRPTGHQLTVVQDLAEQWPVGTRVRHKHSMWVGTVVPGSPTRCPGRYVGVAPAHCYLPAMAGLEPGLVCVEWDHPDTQPGADERGPLNDVWPHPQIGTAWMRPGVLRVARREARERRTR